ncbi:DEKNAAC101193 [Brettanomyces naardenensis]|uniref:Histone H1 n=1 Tax=Brettanomyces naardenensis TaxID=13370 RepID=A0A448YHE9_BRENA|nr:DEKNAAC101193 [Brettanomyces naardenensis]
MATAKTAKLTYKDMIVSAVSGLKERNGSSRQALKKYIQSNFDVAAGNFDSQFNLAIKRGVSGDYFVQPKGPSGPIKLNKAIVGHKKSTPAKKVAPAKKASAAKKAVKKETTTKKSASSKKTVSKKVVKKVAAKRAPKKAVGTKKAPAKKSSKSAKKVTSKKPAAKKAKTSKKSSKA